MARIKVWMRRVFAGCLCVMFVGWCWAEAEQWLLRWRAEKLFREFQSLQVGAPAANLDEVAARWQGVGAIFRFPHAGSEEVPIESRDVLLVRLQNRFPAFWDDDYYHSLRLGHRFFDLLGLRRSGVVLTITNSNAKLVGRDFGVEVFVPNRDWETGWKYPEPSLGLGAIEKLQFRDTDVPPSPTNRRLVVRRYKGDYGIGMKFTPDLDAAEKKKAVDFRFGCITAFVACRSEGDILPEAEEQLRRMER